jgi:CheY-like chemotaxis protein
MGNVDLALATLAPESSLRLFLERANTAAQRAADLTNQMLAYSGKGRFVVEPIDLSWLVNEMGPLLATVTSKRAIVQYHLADGLPPVEADATQLRQVVMNLITNASDALGEGEGVIQVSTGVVEADSSYLPSGPWNAPLPEGRYAYVEVSDSGCGMDAATQAKIFDPFFTTKQTGRGLGLAAVLGIVQGHGGGVHLQSEPGKGTRFQVLLPVAEHSGEPACSAVSAGGSGWRGRGTVLLVDDEEIVRTTTRAMLEQCGFTVLTASDGIEAVEVFRARTGEIAAVILDVTMPRMGGEEAFRQMHQLDPTVPVILSSGYDEQDAVSRFAGKGLAGFIQKPYRMESLAEKLRKAVNAAPTEAG